MQDAMDVCRDQFGSLVLPIDDISLKKVGPH